MRLKTVLVCVGLMLGSHACTEEFKDCAAVRACPSSSGAAAGGFAGATVNAGGTPTTSLQGGAAPGEPSSGEAGAGTGDAAGGSEGGEGPTLDGACDRDGALSCYGIAQKLLLICRRGTWQPQQTCNADENCDNTSGACAKIVDVCADREPGAVYCEDDTLIECGADLVSAERTPCEGRCRDDVQPASCSSAVCSDGKVQAPEECDDGNDDAGDGCSRDCQWEVRSIIAGAWHTCALSEDGRVKCWGRNDEGQLGRGDSLTWGDEAFEMGDGLVTVDLGSGRSAKALAAGARHTCALLDDGSVKCWGFNLSGQLGQGDDRARGDTPGALGDDLLPIDVGSTLAVVQVEAGGDSTCALLDSGVVKCWGANSFGELGVGDVNNVGDGGGEMGTALVPVDLGNGRHAISVSTGSYHDCALLDDGTVKCWGNNGFGQIGIGTYEPARGDDPDELGDALQTVDFAGLTALQVSAGIGYRPFDEESHRAFSCAVLSDESVGCWGYLGDLGVNEAVGLELNQLGSALPRLRLPLGRTVSELHAGGGHVCALLDDHSVQCWGRNDRAQVGYSTDENPRVLRFGAERSVIALTTGYDHSCVLLDDRSIKCWGANDWGQLGYDDRLDRGLEERDFGDALPTVNVRF